MSVVGTNLSISGNASITGNQTIYGSTTATSANYSGNLSCNNLSCNANIINTTGTITTNQINSTYIDCDNIQSNNSTDNVNLYTTNTGNITIGNSSNSNNIKFNQNIQTPDLFTDNIQNLNNADVAYLYLGNTGGVQIGNPLSSNSVVINPSIGCNSYLATNNSNQINIGSTSNSANINLNQNVATNKTITSSSSINSNSLTTNQVNSSTYQPINVTDNINLFTNNTSTNFNIGNSSNTTNQITVQQPLFCANLNCSNLYLFSNIIEITTINGNTLQFKSNYNLDFIVNNNQCMFITYNGTNYLIQCNAPILCSNIQPLNVSDAINLYTTNTSTNFNIGNSANTANNIVFNQPVTMGTLNVSTLNASTIYLFGSSIEIDTITANTLQFKSPSNIQFFTYGTQCMNITYNGTVNQVQISVPLCADIIQSLGATDTVLLYPTSTGSISFGNTANTANNIVFNQSISIPKAPTLSYTSLPTYGSNDIGLIKYFTNTNFSLSASGTIVKTPALSLGPGVWCINYYAACFAIGTYTITQLVGGFSINGTSTYVDPSFGIIAVSGFYNTPQPGTSSMILNGVYYFSNTTTQNCYIIGNFNYTGTPSSGMSLYGQAVRIA